MASGSNPFGAERLDELTTCPQCEQTLSDPRVLPCSHTLCLPCLQQRCTSTATDHKYAARVISDRTAVYRRKASVWCLISEGLSVCPAL